MKKLLLSLVALAGMVSASAQTVIWENAEGVELSWGSNAVCNTAASECASYKAGDELWITVIACDPTKDDYPQAVLKTGEWKDLWSDSENFTHITKDKEFPYVIKIVLTEALADTIKAKGFFVSGIASTCSKVEYKSGLAMGAAEEFTGALSAEVVSGLNPNDKVTVVYEMTQTAGDGTVFNGWGMGNVVVNTEGWPNISGASLSQKQLGENRVTFEASTLLAAEGAKDFGFNINLWGQSQGDNTVKGEFIKWIIERVMVDDSPISDIQAEGEVVEVSYTSLAGVKSSEPVKGINIKTVVYSNGAKHVSRIVVK